MLGNSSDRIFDTLIDTKLNRVSMLNITFYLRKDYSTQNENLICVSITKSGYARERFGLGLYVDPKFWDDKNRKIVCANKELQDKQLILDNIRSKFTSIITSYRLIEKTLTPAMLKDEYLNKISRINFIAFFNEALQEEKSKFTKGTFVRHTSVYNKLKDYQPYVPFNELTISWFNKYRNFLKQSKDNKDTTINSNFSCIRKYLNIAEKNGVKLQFNIDDFFVGDTRGNRNYLSAKELNSMMEFYYSSFIKPGWKLILGYFLFACMNGLRITNVLNINRYELLDTDLSIVMIKGNKDRMITMNETVKKIIQNEPDLFIKKVSQAEINRELKNIAKLLGIRKKITFHVSRHTFATLFLKSGGKVEMLQLLLGHSSITQTMVYVHLVMADANEEVFILDSLFKFDGDRFIA